MDRCIIVVLTCIFSVTNNINTSTHTLVYHPNILLRKSIQYFCLFSNCAVCFLIMTTSLFSCVLAKYLSFNFLDSTLKIKVYFIFMYMCLCMSVCKCTPGVPMEAREGSRVPGTGLTGGYELPDVSARNWTSVFDIEQKVLSTAEPSSQTLISVLQREENVKENDSISSLMDPGLCSCLVNLCPIQHYLSFLCFSSRCFSVLSPASIHLIYIICSTLYGVRYEKKRICFYMRMFDIFVTMERLFFLY